GLLYVGEGAGRQQYMYDPLNYAAAADVSLGEFWVPRAVREDVRAVASVAHTHGRTLVGAEAFTGSVNQAGWRHHPFSLKPVADQAFCAGVNHLALHRFAH